MKAQTNEGGGPPSPTAAALSAIAALVREHDRDRFQTALFAPADRRQDLLALYAFNYEVARVRESVHEPMLGRIRLQWWRESLDAAYAGLPVRKHPVAEALAAAIASRPLTRAHFEAIIDAREQDLDPDPPPTLAALEAYAEGSSSRLVLLALETLGVRDDLASDAGAKIGVAYALAGLVRAMPLHARAGRCYIPAELAARTGLDPRDYAALRPTPALRAATAEIGAIAAARLDDAAATRESVPRAALPALLPAVIARHALGRLAGAGWNPFDPALTRPDTLQSWRLLLAGWRGRF